MHLSGLADAVLADPALDQALADARDGRVRALDLTGPESLRPFVVAGLARAGRTVLAVTATGREAEDLVASLGDLVDPSLVGYYPSWETLPHERLSPRSDTVGRRLAVLRKLDVNSQLAAVAAFGSLREDPDLQFSWPDE